MMRAILFASLLLTLGLVAATPSANAQPNPCHDYGLCFGACVDQVSASCPGTVCVGYSTQIPVCVPKAG